MKKILATVLSLCMLSGPVSYAGGLVSEQNREYELWAQAPAITCGYTNNDMCIFKSLEEDIIELLPLDKIGPNYYFAICSRKMEDGGYSGKSKTTEFFFYTLYATEKGFIILGCDSSANEYWWDEGYSMADMSELIDSSYYMDNDSEKPCYIITPKGRYENSNYTIYDEYFIVTETGKLYIMKETEDSGIEGYPYIKDGILYRGQDAYKKTSTQYPYYYMDDGKTKASNSKTIQFKNGSIIYGTAFKVPVAEMTEENGYTMYKKEFTSNIDLEKYFPVPGSDNLFFRTSNVYTENSVSGESYYYLKVDVYKSENGNMILLNSETIPTTRTRQDVYTYYQINDLDESYYINQGLPVPAVALQNVGVIAKDGTICALNLDSSIYVYCYPCTYNGRFAIARARNGVNSIYKPDPEDDGYKCYWQVINEISFDSSGKRTLGSDIELRIKSTAHPGQNGFFSSYTKWESSNFGTLSDKSIKAWWGRNLTNVFPDGRTVTASWVNVYGNTYEIWYNIYNPDGTLKATGPTGYSLTSSYGPEELFAWTINDSKFVVCRNKLNNSFLKEYYRATVVEENETGEVVSKIDLGEKNIMPPDTSDTEVVQSRIDFTSTELPLGYNIKDNVIDSDKLDVMLRDQVNSIRLNDIVILTNAGYQSGEQNTGISLDTYSDYDYSFGSSYIRFYTNGQYFRWYCYSPEELTPGTYSKTLEIGDKTIYVTFKIVEPPTNEGSTTVVF